MAKKKGLKKNSQRNQRGKNPSTELPSAAAANLNPSEPFYAANLSAAKSPLVQRLNPAKNLFIISATAGRGLQDVSQQPMKPNIDPWDYPPSMPLENVIANILKKPPLMGVENALADIWVRRGARASTQLVEDVLRLCQDVGLEAVTFFKWVSLHLGDKHTPKAWNLLIDILGSSGNFDEMWKWIGYMKVQQIASVETFSSVFACYVSCKKVQEALMSFDVIDQYGCPKDVVSLNCLLGSLCNCNHTIAAENFLEEIKGRIAPNHESYALLMEGFEKEGNVSKAWKTFGQLTLKIGWNMLNYRSYCALARTLMNANQASEALNFLDVLCDNKCISDISLLSATLQSFYKNRDIKNAYKLWEIMMKFTKETGMAPDTPTFNAMVGVFCSAGELDYAYRVLDEMVFFGSFPDFKTYNTIFEAFIAVNKVEDASSIFREMTRNEFSPLYPNYASAIKMYFNADDPEMAVTMWKHMVQKEITPKAEAAAALIEGYCDLGRVSEARKYCEEALSRSVPVPAEAMTKLKHALGNSGSHGVYEKLEKKLRSLPHSTK